MKTGHITVGFFLSYETFWCISRCLGVSFIIVLLSVLYEIMCQVRTIEVIFEKVRQFLAAAGRWFTPIYYPLFATSRIDH